MFSSYSQQMIRTILVDDEDLALHRLRDALKAHPTIKVIGEAKTGKEAVALINEYQPDLVFLDILMPELTGLEVVTRLQQIPMIVFVTAYEEYAVKAFELNSLDYLLKPVEPARLALTIERILQRGVGANDILDKIKGMLEPEKKKVISTIPINVGNKINLVYTQDVFFFEAKDKYVFIHTADNIHLVDYSLTYLEERLPPEFIRIHRSHIINKLKLRELHKYFKGTFIFVMNDAKQTRLKSAASYSEIIRTHLLMP